MFQISNSARMHTGHYVYEINNNNDVQSELLIITNDK